MCRILIAGCLFVCSVVECACAQNVTAPNVQAPIFDRNATASGEPSETSDLLLQAAKLLDAAGEHADAKRLRGKARAQDKMANDVRLLKEKLAQRDVLQREIELLRDATRTWQQVVVNVKVMELSLTKLRDSDFHFDGIDHQKLGESGVRALIFAGELDSPENRQHASGKTRNDGKQAVGLAGFTIIDQGSSTWALLEALKTTNALKVLANPTMVTISGRPAYFNEGGEFPILVPGSSGSTVEYKKFGTQVDLVPWVLGNQKVRLEIRPRVSEIDEDRSVLFNGIRVPGLRVREVDLGLEMRIGQSAVFGGLIQQRTKKRTASAGRPAAAGLGLEEKESRETIEVIFVVTPELVQPPRDGPVAATAAASDNRTSDATMQ